jgi:Holliday junction resolvase RusA-like endonuclease
MQEIVIEIDGLQLPSWNVIYSNTNWGARKNIVDKVHNEIQWHLNQMDFAMFECVVDIKVECYYKNNRRPDSDNVCDKLVIDSLRGVVIANDDWRYVRYTTSASLLDRERPRTVITISEVAQ